MAAKKAAKTTRKLVNQVRFAIIDAEDNLVIFGKNASRSEVACHKKLGDVIIHVRITEVTK